jgi:ribonuclease-3
VTWQHLDASPVRTDPGGVAPVPGRQGYTPVLSGQNRCGGSTPPHTAATGPGRTGTKVAVPNEADLARLLGVRFRDPKRLTEALTHRSYLHDHPGTPGEANERLEFLGDAVLALVVAEMLCARFPLAPEGELTALRALLVSTAALADVAEGLGLDRFIRASGGEGSLAGRGRPRMLAGTVEAIVAAVHLDGGIRAARSLATRLLRPRIEVAARDVSQANVKGRLQEHVQAQSGETPRYVIVRRDGPVHAERFLVEVRATDRVLGAGEGTGKRAAEQAAARDALARLTCQSPLTNTAGRSPLPNESVHPPSSGGRFAPYTAPVATGEGLSERTVDAGA